MKSSTHNRKIFIALIIILPLYFIHIPFAYDEEILKIFRMSEKINQDSLLLGHIKFLALFALCIAAIIFKKWLDSKYQLKWYRICSSVALNLVFMFMCFLSLEKSLGFYCTYYWSFNCKDNAEDSLCSNFPPEIDIAYLFATIPLFSALVLLLSFMAHNKILGFVGKTWFLILLGTNAVAILMNVGRNGVGCYD
ncbi:hypothetical protein OQH61_04565 [Helicobacter sp. MIT 21-1697]|uniref:hypothetical protein n=1 Tax=Helicobacter sp. MIT 21-1697 TaxID=2993733 RepID=UPI00224B6B9E|nr:hypothetical protein [Helicobacter sp. MIT 21-1697]MCX2717006.1 hypothetical protein [Helicobacter sp. MIT 21-1697]